MMTQEKSQLEYDHQGSGANVWIDRQGVALLLTVVLLGVLLGTAALWIGLRWAALNRAYCAYRRRANRTIATARRLRTAEAAQLKRLSEQQHGDPFCLLHEVDFFSDGIRGYDWLKQNNRVTDVADLSASYV
jgi:hypothetical protein